MTAQEYVLLRGWDLAAVEATALDGVAPEDVEALASTDITPEELLAYCQEQVEQRAEQ